MEDINVYGKDEADSDEGTKVESTNDEAPQVEGEE